MTTQDKKQPALLDTDLMSFGKYNGTPMQDVSANYLAWLWDQDWIKLPKFEKLYNYIYNSKEAIELELGRKI